MKTQKAETINFHGIPIQLEAIMEDGEIIAFVPAKHVSEYWHSQNDEVVMKEIMNDGTNKIIHEILHGTNPTETTDFVCRFVRHVAIAANENATQNITAIERIVRNNYQKNRKK